MLTGTNTNQKEHVVNRLMSRVSIHAAVLCVLGFVAAPAQAQQKDGDLWEVTSEMSMPGMPAGMQMPGGGPRDVCVKRNDPSPPVAAERCEMYDRRQSGSTYSWKMRCEGNTTGSGDITYEGRDRYRGTMTMNHEGQAMTMKLAGRRLGDCDTATYQGQAQRQVAAAQRQGQDAMDQACARSLQQMQPAALRGDSPYKCNPKYKPEFCAKLQTQEGFALVASRRRPQGMAGIQIGDLQESAEFCGVKGEDIRERLCRRAEQQESLEFLSSSCVGQGGTPGYGAQIVTRECAGRTFSSPPAEKYMGVCSAAARQGLMQPTADAGKKGAAPPRAAEAKPAEAKPAEPTAAETAVDQGKRLLKGIFGR